MYRPIPELYRNVEDRADLISTKKDGANPGNDALCTSNNCHAAMQIEQVSLRGNA